MSGSGYGSWSNLEKLMDRDPVCPERLAPDPMHIWRGSETLYTIFQHFKIEFLVLLFKCKILCVCVCVYLEETGLIKVGWLVHTAYTGCSKKPRNNQYFQSLALHAASLLLVSPEISKPSRRRWLCTRELLRWQSSRCLSAMIVAIGLQWIGKTHFFPETLSY